MQLNRLAMSLFVASSSSTLSCNWLLTVLNSSLSDFRFFARASAVAKSGCSNMSGRPIASQTIFHILVPLAATLMWPSAVA